jgi:hypothetical protein
MVSLEIFKLKSKGKENSSATVGIWSPVGNENQARS